MSAGRMQAAVTTYRGYPCDYYSNLLSIKLEGGCVFILAPTGGKKWDGPLKGQGWVLFCYN